MSLYSFSVIDLKLGKVQPLESATAPASRLRRPASAPSLGFAPHQLSSKSVLNQLSAKTAAKQRPATAAPRRAEEKARRLAIEKRLSAVPAHKQVVSHRHFPRHVWNPLGNAVAASAAAATQPGSPTWKARTHRLEREKLRRAFKWIDVNNDGMIDANELHAATARLGGTLTLRQVRDIIWEVDDDLNGKLSWDEFEAAYFRCQIDATGFAPRRFFFIAEFLLMDRDFSGAITLDEAMSVLFHRQGAGALEAAMPMCDDQRKAGGGSEFVPHMTICHYASRAEAEEAKARLEASDEWRPTTFRVADAAVHVMLRQGDSGQFERCATVALGRGAAEAQLLEPPARFVGMPLEEEEWVRAARMEAKKARYGPRGGGRRGGRRRSPRRSPEEREEVRNRSPEQIAEIRRQRAAKKERARLLES